MDRNKQRFFFKFLSFKNPQNIDDVSILLAEDWVTHLSSSKKTHFYQITEFKISGCTLCFFSPYKTTFIRRRDDNNKRSWEEGWETTNRSARKITKYCVTFFFLLYSKKKKKKSHFWLVEKRKESLCPACFGPQRRHVNQTGCFNGKN